MKRVFVTLSVLCMLLTSKAQSNGWLFSFSMGQSFPQNSYKLADPTNPSSGYARNGFNLLLDAKLPLDNHFGLKGMLLVNSSPIDQNQIGNSLKGRINNQITIDPADNQYVTYTTNNWMWNGLLFGPSFTINMRPVYWDFQVLAGMNLAYLPQQKLSYIKPGSDWYYLDQNTATTNISYGLLLGTALRFPVMDRVNLKLGFDSYRSQASVRYEQLKISKQGDTVVTEQLKQGGSTVPIQTLIYSLGFVYYLK